MDTTSHLGDQGEIRVKSTWAFLVEKLALGQVFSFFLISSGVPCHYRSISDSLFFIHV